MAEKKLTGRLKRRAERIVRDGYMYHPDAPHGTRSGYEYYGCRCNSCVLEGNKYKKPRTTKKSRPHGKLWGDF